MEALQRDYQRARLLRRDDRTPQSKLEGAFLPASFWLARYCAGKMTPSAHHYLDAGLRHANDVGVLPEKVDWQDDRVLGDLPLGMTHASLMALIKHRNARKYDRPPVPGTCN
ncbi:MAG: hypothetical protein ACREFT_10150, partial [Acetobacteraceae bacterium]